MASVNAIIHRIELLFVLCLGALHTQSDDDVYEEIFFTRSVEWKMLLHISKLCSFHVSSML